MSDWIQSCTNLARHRKTRRLAEILGISRPLAVGYITCFWHRVMEESPEGDLSLWRPEDVADAAMYEGNADQFHAALIESGFLEVDGRGQRPHDWEDYAGRLIDRRRSDRERKRAARAKAAVPEKVSAGRPAELLPRPDLPDPPERTGPDQPDVQDPPETPPVAPPQRQDTAAKVLVDEFYEAIGLKPHSLTRTLRKRELVIAAQLAEAGAPPGEASAFVAWCRAAPYRPVPSDLRVYEQKRAQFLAHLEPVAAGPPGRNGTSAESEFSRGVLV